jgi:hypothetical protein
MFFSDLRGEKSNKLNCHAGGVVKWYRLHLPQRRPAGGVGREIESRQGICSVVTLKKESKRK